jgi:hypothetical protein
MGSEANTVPGCMHNLCTIQNSIEESQHGMITCYKSCVLRERKKGLERVKGLAWMELAIKLMDEQRRNPCAGRLLQCHRFMFQQSRRK